MLWTSQGMQMWTFDRSRVPPSIKNRSLTPVLSEFGPPVANFQGSCDFDAHFFNHQMIFNTDFCGSNAGETFQMHGCPMVSFVSHRPRSRQTTVCWMVVALKLTIQSQATTKSWESCNIYVANNPQAFVDSYWEVNFLDVYEVVAGAGLVPVPVPVPSPAMSLNAGAVWPASWTTPAPFASRIPPA
jgi:hypothetical protein